MPSVLLEAALNRSSNCSFAMESGHGNGSRDGRGEVAIGIDDVASRSNHAATAEISGGGEEPLLCRLARCGDKLALEQALTGNITDSSTGMIINQKSGRSGVSPLHLAAVHGHAEAVKCLLDHKADADIAHEESGNTPLHLAVMMGRLPVAEELVRAGAHLCKMNKEGMMPVSYCRTGDMLETLLQHFPNFYSVRGRLVMRQDDARASVIDKHQKTILHYAAQYGQSSGNISRLLDCWAGCGDLLDEEEDYNTFLAEAVKAGNAEAVKAVKTFGFLPAAQPSNYLELLSSVLLAPHENSHGYSTSRAELVLRELLELGVPSGFDGSRLTIESLIVKRLNAELDQSTSIDEKMRDDLSNLSPFLPTYLALFAKRHLAFEFMLERAPGLRVNQWDEKRKRTCLHWAVQHRRRDIVEKLLGMKDAALISPSIEDADGKTALQLAFESKQQEVRESMLERRPAFKADEEKLSKDREVYAAATNAILVGAVLVASVTYAGCLQPPKSQPEQVKRWGATLFWAANNLAFTLSLATVFVAIGALLPTPKKYVASIVRLLRGSLVLAAFLLALSLLLADFAFRNAGIRAVPHDELLTYRFSLLSGSALWWVAYASFIYQVFRLRPSVGSNTHTREGFSNVPSSALRDALRRTLSIPQRESTTPHPALSFFIPPKRLQ